MHEDILHNCLLGCPDCPDSLAHYVQCPHVFALHKFFINEASADPLARLGLIQTHTHDLKAQIRSGKLQPCIATDAETFHPGPFLRQAWSVYAQAFAAEAGELSINHRS